MYNRILVVNEGNLDANGAFQPSLMLARQFSAELHMLIVQEMPRFSASMAEVMGERQAGCHRAAFILANAEKQAREANVKLRSHVVVGQLPQQVVSFVEENQIDLVVIGARGVSRRPYSVFYNRFERLIWSVGCAVHILK